MSQDQEVLEGGWEHQVFQGRWAGQEEMEKEA